MKIKFIALIALVCNSVLCSSTVFSQNSGRAKIKIGAYYFDGWTGENFHLNQKLKDSFPERMPIWGWVTSTPEIMQKQIDVAADHGINFFSFCWYYSNLSRNNQKETLDNALYLYLSAGNRTRLQFNILVVNHVGFIVGPSDWDNLIKIWMPLLKNQSYLKVDDKPLISFFSVASLVTAFGSEEAVHEALDKLRSSAIQQGLNGVTVAACISPSISQINQAKECGFDVLTAYNFNSIGFSNGERVAPIDSLIIKEISIWDKYKQSDLPTIPVATLNFDPRPWNDMNDYYKKAGRYIGYSSSSVYKSVTTLKQWVLKNSSNVTREKIAIVYAWNENGEGAWLTPSPILQSSLLDGLTKAIQ